MNFLKHIYLLFFWVVFSLACINKKKQNKKTISYVPSALPKESYKFDTIRFNKKYYPDTSGCERFTSGRSIKEILINEYATINKSSVDTFLATSKYIRLWICNLPSLSLNIKDTVIISGVVYSIGGSEGRMGWPTILTKVITKQPQ